MSLLFRKSLKERANKETVKSDLSAFSREQKQMLATGEMSQSRVL